MFKLDLKDIGYKPRKSIPTKKRRDTLPLSFNVSRRTSRETFSRFEDPTPTVRMKRDSMDEVSSEVYEETQFRSARLSLVEPTVKLRIL